MADTDGSGFGKFVPGFEFMQNLARQAAGGIAQGVQQSVPQLPSLNSWVAPTFSVEELEKRIAELKAVQFWLDQNARALSATVQALEVQKMTLATLQGMNVNLGDVANALKVRATDTMATMAGMAGLSADAPKEPTRFKGLEVPPRTGAPEPAPTPAPAPAAKKSTTAQAAATPASAVVDPMLWWGSLSQQFQNIATQAMKDVATQAALDTSRNVAASLTREAVKTATQAATAVAQTAVQAGSGLVGAGVRAASTGAKVARKAATPAATAASAAAPKAAAKAPAAGRAGTKTAAKSAAKPSAKPSAKPAAKKAAGTTRPRSR